MKRIAIAMAAVAALIAPSAASAHVSVHPNAVPAGANATLDIRVPNEMDNAKTTKLQVRFPPGFIGVSTQPPPGWSSNVQTSKLATPVQTDDGPIDTQVSEVDWTAGSGAGIPAGQFANFPISVALPSRPGQTLTFKTVQTYSNGKVARWIGAPDSDSPAPTIDVVSSNSPAYDVSGDAGPPSALPASLTSGGSSSTTKPVSDASSSTQSSSDSASKGLGIAALVVGILALVVGGVALATRRREA